MITLKIFKFLLLELGWFPGEDWTLFKVELLGLYADGDGLTIVDIHILKLAFVVTVLFY